MASYDPNGDQRTAGSNEGNPGQAAVPGGEVGAGPVRPEARTGGVRGQAKGRAAKRVDPHLSGASPTTDADLIRLAQGIADPDRKEAPDDQEARSRWPALYFLMSMPKSLGGELCDSGGFSFFGKGGLWHWTVKAPGTNRKLSGASDSLATLFDDAEAAIARGEALVSPLKREREERFQKSRKKD